MELLGQPVWDTPLAPITEADLAALFVWPNRSGEPVLAERLMLARDGERLRVMWSCNVVSSPSGAPECAVITGVDVTSERASSGLITHLMQADIGTSLIGIDNRGLVTVFNQGASLLLGFNPEEVIGKPFVELLDTREVRERTSATSGVEQFLSLVGSIDLDQVTPPRDWTWIDRDGRPIQVSMSLSMTDDAVSDRVGFLCVGQDVTRQRETQRTLAAALDTERAATSRLRELDRAKDEFVSTVSHELRTPTTSIAGYTELLLAEAEHQANNQLPLLRAIERNGRRLVVLCDDLLILSGFQTEALRGDAARIDLGQIIRSAEEAVKFLLGRRRLEVVFTVPGRDVEVNGDAGQIDRILINLITNAIKFTEDGGRIEVALSEEGNQAVIRVTDTGIGIPPDDHDLVFERFYRTTTAQQRAIQGTGLGLAIVSGIVEAHDGRTDLTSEVGVGTTITVCLPLAPPVLSLVATPSDETG